MNMTELLFLAVVSLLVVLAVHLYKRRKPKPPTNRPKSDGGPGEEKPR